jgi:predicted DNA-binding transcriptional regulator
MRDKDKPQITMNKDNVVGAVILVASIAVIGVYVWLTFFPPLIGLDLFILKLTGSVAIAGIFGILAWIGYTLATTPPPKPIEEIEKEIEEGKISKQPTEEA